QTTCQVPRYSCCPNLCTSLPSCADRCSPGKGTGKAARGVKGAKLINGSALPARKSFASMTVREKENLRAAIRPMKQMTDKTGWESQAGIRGGTSAGFGHPHDCQHRNDYFLAWHRGYLYFFESLLRKHAVDAGLTGEDANIVLPYWDWSADATIPAEFRDPT